ncbi:MAG: hypothetical protein M1597_00555 [Candidatus Thermoplasmatota archaeon]|jgi:hypothetical protein|nr:hypothetical protein [Candidatus Thermoplasmatota archaeon]
MALRAVRAKVGKNYSRKIIIYPTIYLLLTLYSTITLTLFQFEFSMVVYLTGFIIGFIIGDLSQIIKRKGNEIYQSSAGVAIAWSFLFLVKWYTYLYEPTFPTFVDPIITITFTFLAGIILGETVGIVFKHFRTR